jgi:long-chain acyl-CoA synthetase
MLEQTVGLFSALQAGTTVFYATSRRSSALLAAMQRHRVQLLVCVPELLRLLLAGLEREVERRGRRRQWERLLALADRLPIELRPRLFRSVHQRLGGCLRLVQCGGAPLQPDLWRSWERLGVRVVEGYGATECAPIVTCCRLRRRLPGSVGWPIRGVEVRLATDGEVLVRGPNVTPGYWRDPAATAEAFAAGWYRTGDVGAFGPAGDLRLLGRKKELIVLPDGRNVFPDDVETILQQDPAVKECAVVGRRAPNGTVEVHAVVVPAGSPAAALAAARRANQRLGPHQQIGGVSLWPQAGLPHTASLKVQRVTVRAALEQQARPAPAAPPAGPRPDDLEAQVRRLLARAARRPLDAVQPAAELAFDLGLDSLARVELAVLLEEQLGRSPSDEQMAALRTVADLLAALQREGEGEAEAAAVAPLPAWPRAAPARLARALLQDLLLFPLLRRFARPLTVVHPARLGARPGPLLLIANHASHVDTPAILASLPPGLRRRTAVAAAADYFFARQPLAFVSALLLGAFPFHRQGPIAASLAHCGDLADAGYSLLIYPEGTRSSSGELQPFKSGIGLLARELGLPILPLYLAGPHAILPKGSRWPRPGPLCVTVGQPVRLEPGLTNAEATGRLEALLGRLAAESD